MAMLSQVLIKNDQGKYERFCSPERGGGDSHSHVSIRPIPKTKGKGHFSTISIRQGLGMGMCCGRFDKEYSARITLEKPSVYFGFCLKGQTLTWNACHRTPVSMIPDRSYVYYFDDPVFQRKTKGRQDVHVLVIRVAPEMLFHLLGTEQQQDAQYGASMGEIMIKRYLYADHPMTTQMKTTLYQIFNNPHQGRIGKIYLESKALELIALKLEQVEQPADFSGTAISLSSKDKASIYRARDLLVNALQYPPSLNALAGQVGMSHTRLNRGFKKMFGCTAFEYLRRERLAYARMLIEKNPDDLTRIAYEAGFCSSSHFATAFYKAFGIKPSEYRKAFQMVSS